MGTLMNADQGGWALTNIVVSASVPFHIRGHLHASAFIRVPFQ
jgi:hypothetical protein